MYPYFTLAVLDVALVALALTEWWWLRLKEEDIDRDDFLERINDDIYVRGMPMLVGIPDVYRRHIPVLVPDDTPKEADRFVRSGR